MDSPRARLRLWLKLFLLLLLVASSLTARPLPAKAAQPDYTLYHDLAGVFKAVRETVVQCPSIMQITELSEGDAAYSANMTVVTVEPGGLSQNHTHKYRLLLDFGEHGRELISSEIALRLLGALCTGGPALAQLAARAGVGLEQLQGLLNQTVLQVLPMENVRGRELVERGALCERKNGRGVDPNRNWGVHWGHKEADYDPSEEYPGTAPFSEPEALMVRRVAEALRPHVWLNVHSGMAALFMPYDHQNRIPEGAGANATLAMLSTINQRICNGSCAVGSGGKSVGYLAHGTATDYMYEELRVPISLTWEVYGDMNASYHDCFRMFNPLTREAFNETVDTWAAGVLALLSLLPEHPDVAAQQAAAQQGPAAAAAAEQQGAPGGAAQPGTAAPRQGVQQGIAQQGMAQQGELVNTSARQAQQAQQDAAGEGVGRRGGVTLELDEEEGNGGGEGAQQQQQQQQKGDGGGSGGNGGGGTKERAGEIAAALLGDHPRGGGTQAAGGVGAIRMGSGGGSGGGAAEGWGPAAAARRAWGHHHFPGTKADWEAVGLFFLAVGAIIGGYMAYTKPRVRYMLSRWGLLTRRNDIPL